jgi:uncharacterized protein
MMAGPVRTCVACRRRRRQEDLLRVARRPEGTVLPDAPGARAEGRGAYLCPDRDCIKRAVRSGRLNQALRLPQKVPATLEQELVRVMSRRTGAE